MTSENEARFGFTPRSDNWTSLRLLNIYRIGVASIFFSQSFIQFSPLLNIYNLPLYAWTSFGYLLMSLLITMSSWIDRRNFQLQVSIQTYVDIIAIILIMHACGGISSGLGMLLIISIAVSGLLGKDSLAIIFASLATVGLLVEYAYSATYTYYSGTSTQVGLLGAALFATALVTQSLTRRIRSSEAVIQQQKLDVANLSALNSEILQNMQSGVLALDSKDQVRHINDVAHQMLDQHLADFDPNKELPIDARAFIPEIYQELMEWRSSPLLSSRFLKSATSNFDIQISFHNLQSRSHQGTLIFLDDVSKLKHQMQQSKLASLGQLTANIAHEIRNPLAAISHAAQLLAENDELPLAEKRMTEIIQQHSNRINEIIEDIMQISRGRVASEDHIQLKNWISQFIESYSPDGDRSSQNIEFNIEAEDMSLVFDSGHLNRIITNLCNNALTHSQADTPVQINIYKDTHQATCIEVADQGEGISAEELDKIFEPFYTTSHKGTGLGLYIVSQLCELNDAAISVIRNQSGGASFILCKQAE